MKQLKKINLSSKEKRAILIAKKKYDVSQLVLFGSKARGGADAESDVDILVICLDMLLKGWETVVQFIAGTIILIWR